MPVFSFNLRQSICLVCSSIYPSLSLLWKFSWKLSWTAASGHTVLVFQNKNFLVLESQNFLIHLHKILKSLPSIKCSLPVWTEKVLLYDHSNVYAVMLLGQKLGLNWFGCLGRTLDSSSTVIAFCMHFQIHSIFILETCLSEYSRICHCYAFNNYELFS